MKRQFLEKRPLENCREKVGLGLGEGGPRGGISNPNRDIISKGPPQKRNLQWGRKVFNQRIAPLLLRGKGLIVLLGLRTKIGVRKFPQKKTLPRGVFHRRGRGRRKRMQKNQPPKG